MIVSSKQSGLGRRGAARVAAVAGVVLAMLVFAGCAKRNRLVDPGLTMPLGTPSADARMVVWYDDVTDIVHYEDLPPVGPSPADTVIGHELVRLGTPGEVHGMIFDRTAATRYQMLRRESGGGFRVFQDFGLRPTRKWLPKEWEIYRFDDATPSDFSPSTYLGRGRVDDVIADSSPLTNMVELNPTALEDITITIESRRTVPVDSTDIVIWTPVTGAVAYWVHIYEFRAAPTFAKIQSGLPMPVYDGFSTDDLLLYVTGDTRYTMGDTTRTDVEILFERPLLPQPDPSYNQPLVRITAVDALGRIIGYSRGSKGEARISDTEYGLFQLGARQLDRLRRPRPGR